jgi:integrase
MLTDTACRNAKPKDKPYKLTDGYGLYLFVTPTAKLWRLAYRFGGKQKTMAFGAYPTVNLTLARTRREAAKLQLAHGVDPMATKKETKRRAAAEAAALRPFGIWADEWLEKQRPEFDDKTMAGKARYVDYLKREFGSASIPTIRRLDVVLFLREFEKVGKLETRDRVRATGEQICIYAAIEGDDYNPFRNLKAQLTANKSTKRPALTKPADVVRLFRTIAAPFERARFDDLVGHALRFLSLTVARPGEVAHAEWSEFDFDAARWTVPAEKMKMANEHVVPLSRQAVALLRQVQALTADRQFVFSCHQDAPISDNTLNKRLRDLGFDTASQHCAHGFRSTFSTLCNAEEDRDDNKMWDGDLIELQLAHLDESSVRAVYNRIGPLALIGARAKLMQHWADRIDTMIGKNVVPIRQPSTVSAG